MPLSQGRIYHMGNLGTCPGALGHRGALCDQRIVFLVFLCGDIKKVYTRFAWPSIVGVVVVGVGVVGT